jgi:hypothetical protein
MSHISCHFNSNPKIISTKNKKLNFKCLKRRTGTDILEISEDFFYFYFKIALTNFRLLCQKGKNPIVNTAFNLVSIVK